MTKFWTIIPVKDTRFSKQRLAARFDAAQRQKLALTMLEDVLAAVAPTCDLSRLALVTVDPAAVALARHYTARVIEDGAHDGHTGAVVAAARVAKKEGATGFLTVPGDIPLATADEIKRLLDAHSALQVPSFTIAPSHDEFGSNAVAMSPPGAVPLRFGDDSYRPHLAAARAGGIEPAVLNLPGVADDVDTPDDIDRIRENKNLRTTRTFALLQEFMHTDTAPAESTP